MEPMSIERLLLANWEEEGFIGKNRVPIDREDLDVLALNPNTKTIRIGQVKVRGGSQLIEVVDDLDLARMTAFGTDFESWLVGDWASWLKTLPKAWDNNGMPVVPWLPPISQVDVIEVVFSCNHRDFTRQSKVIDDSLQRAVERHLRQNKALPNRLDAGMVVRGKVCSTLELVCNLFRLVFRRIHEDSYGRRFGDPFKDLVREVHRYLYPELHWIPKNKQGVPTGTQKAPFHTQVRKQAIVDLLDSLGVTLKELR